MGNGSDAWSNEIYLKNARLVSYMTTNCCQSNIAVGLGENFLFQMRMV